MFKKIASILFFFMGISGFIGFIGSADELSYLSTPAILGRLLGVAIPTVSYIYGGIILLMFDNAYKKNYVDGFKMRKSQSVPIIVLCIIYCILFEMMCFTSAVYPAFVVGILFFIYIIPVAIYIFIFSMYIMPLNASKKYFLNNDALIQEYLGNPSAFKSYSPDNAVLASDNALFFPKHFCLIPFNQIKSVEYKTMLAEPLVYFHLFNGKKFSITTTKYDNIMAALNANCQK